MEIKSINAVEAYRVVTSDPENAYLRLLSMTGIENRLIYGWFRATTSGFMPISDDDYKSLEKEFQEVTKGYKFKTVTRKE